ncbi:MarC family protein [Candidatus Woesearchaeota archaeon]|nr:MAG: MarC family protein [Candidatus Woesearchaeota archaeon]
MIPSIIGFLAMLNPFALFLYLQPIMKELDDKTFRKVLFKASLISFLIYAFFLLSGEFIFKEVLQIHFESFRIFGGIIIFSFAYVFIMKGQKALIHMKGDLDDLASEIALPFMVGAGTISLSILLGRNFSMLVSIFLLILIMGINFIFVMLLKNFREQIEKKKFRIAFDKNMEILLRLNGFFVGAIGVNMVITGLNNVFF